MGDSGKEGFEKGGIQERRDSGNWGSGKGGVQDRRDSGKDEFRIGGDVGRRDARKEGCRLQKMRDIRLVGYRKGIKTSYKLSFYVVSCR